jgi:hypothetical protein
MTANFSAQERDELQIFCLWGKNIRYLVKMDDTSKANGW